MAIGNTYRKDSMNANYLPESCFPRLKCSFVDDAIRSTICKSPGALTWTHFGGRVLSIMLCDSQCSVETKATCLEACIDLVSTT